MTRERETKGEAPERIFAILYKITCNLHSLWPGARFIAYGFVQRGERGRARPVGRRLQHMRGFGMQHDGSPSLRGDPIAWLAVKEYSSSDL